MNAIIRLRIVMPGLLVFVLASCATPTIQLYEPQLSSNKASIRFVVKQEQQRYGFGKHSYYVAALSDEKCGVEPPSGRITVFSKSKSSAASHKSLGMLGGEEIPISDKHEIFVPANKPFAFNFRNSVEQNVLVYIKQRSCGFAMSFVPESGKQYEVEYLFEGAEKQCSIRIFLLEERAEHQVVRTPVPMSDVKAFRCRRFIPFL